MSVKLINLLTSKPGLDVIYRAGRIYCGTFRLTVENEQPWMDHVSQGSAVMLCTLHQQFFATIGHFQSYRAMNPSLMISQSKDGDLIAGIAERSGWKTVRGSSSKDGRQSLRRMIENLTRYRLAGHIVDGPRGPMGVIKAGAVQLALSAKAVIVPFQVTSDPAWYFKSWDRFMLPKPFSRVTIRFGRMIDLESEEMRDKTFEEQRQYLEEVMRPWVIA